MSTEAYVHATPFSGTGSSGVLPMEEAWEPNKPYERPMPARLTKPLANGRPEAMTRP